MFERLLPQKIDNAYRGYKIAIWLFGLVVGMKVAQSVFIIFNGYFDGEGRRRNST